MFHASIGIFQFGLNWNYIFYRRPIQIFVFSFPVGLSSISRRFQQVLLGVDERPTEKKNTTIEYDAGEKDNSILILISSKMTISENNNCNSGLHSR